jgi:hypothetical protein
MVVTTMGPAIIATSVSIFSVAAVDRATRAIHPHARRFQPDAPYVSWHRAQVRARARVPLLSIVRRVAPSELLTAVLVGWLGYET